MKRIISSEYGKFLNEIKSRIVSARIQAVRSVNRGLIKLYWDIGKSIVERQEKFGWGKSVVEQLSRDLTREYAGFEGYSRDNLWRMRMFYLAYKDNLKLARLVPELPWGHLELGLGFSFIGNQYRLTLGDNEYFIDLLFYNRKLKCLVALDLKTGKFQPEYAGKMDFYLLLLDEQVKLKDENPSIGIILCADKDQIVVEYILRSIKKPVGVAEYYLTKKFPHEFKGKLPDAESLKLPIQQELK